MGIITNFAVRFTLMQSLRDCILYALTIGLPALACRKCGQETTQHEIRHKMYSRYTNICHRCGVAAQALTVRVSGF